MSFLRLTATQRGTRAKGTRGSRAHAPHWVVAKRRAGQPTKNGRLPGPNWPSNRPLEDSERHRGGDQDAATLLRIATCVDLR